jgi:methionyl aminopeptidase
MAGEGGELLLAHPEWLAMPIILKSKREIEIMRRAGAVVHRIMHQMGAAAKPGATTLDLDLIAGEEMKRAGVTSSSRFYPSYKEGEGFPGYTCISVNEEVIHGVPGPRKLKEGDIVSIDVNVFMEGWVADTAYTFSVEKVSPKVQKLLDVTKGALQLAIDNIKPGKKWSDVARLMQWHVETNGFNVVREFVGHGVGRTMHEDPKVPNFVTPEQMRGDFVLRPGMTIAVEPMVVMGRRDVVLLEDDWTVVTEDRLPAAHFEHTIAVTETGADVLTDGRGA